MHRVLSCRTQKRTEEYEQKNKYQLMTVTYKLLKTGGKLPKNKDLRVVVHENMTVGMDRMGKNIEMIAQEGGKTMVVPYDGG